MLSVSIVSNVPEYEDSTCFVRDDDLEEKLVVRCMIEQLRTVSSKARELLLPQYTDISTQIGSKQQIKSPANESPAVDTRIYDE